MVLGPESEREPDWTLLAGQLLHGRARSEAEAIAALEWLAAGEGKTLSELQEELRGLDGGDSA
jgi:hypothetical protein